MKEASQRDQTIHPDEKRKQTWLQCSISAEHPMTVEASTRKRQRESKEEVKEAKVDRISLLPDHLLHEILSLLPYQKAIATAALSRRWRTIWQTAPDISLAQPFFPSCCSEVRNHRFDNLVDSVLRHRDHAVPVRSFVLRMTREIHDKTKPCNWIRYVSNSALQSLDLTLSGNFSFVTLRSLFHLPSLRVLCLYFRHGSAVINWPATAFLPSLEKLVLAQVAFAPMANDAISKSCPVLKNWRMVFESAPFELEVTSPVLEFLSLENMSSPISGLSICCPSIKKVMLFQPDDNLGPAHFKLSAPGLQTLVPSSTIDSVPASLVSSFQIPLSYQHSYMDSLYNGSLSATFTKL